MLAQLLMQAGCGQLPLNTSCIRLGPALCRLQCKRLGHHEQADGNLGLCMLAGRDFLPIQLCIMSASSSPSSALPSPRSSNSAATAASMCAPDSCLMRHWHTAPARWPSQAGKEL